LAAVEAFLWKAATRATTALRAVRSLANQKQWRMAYKAQPGEKKINRRRFS